jgi:hypothetical protein
MMASAVSRTILLAGRKADRRLGDVRESSESSGVFMTAPLDFLVMTWHFSATSPARGPAALFSRHHSVALAMPIHKAGMTRFLSFLIRSKPV